jgi:2-polyprenyl-3-methyl-5-hydroxy-6-metoxy-1,4-benzoquinol methylase
LYNKNREDAIAWAREWDWDKRAEEILNQINQIIAKSDNMRYSLNKAKYGTHSIIASLLKENTKILDVGCNKGYLKKISPNSDFYGIDFSEAEIDEAKRSYRKVWLMDLNYEYEKFPKELKFDFIVFADILEHLIYPEKVLSYFVKNNLSNSGHVIISLPNVANFLVRFKLLLGSFGYSESGILDKTHLHFYTVKTAMDLAQSVGLKVKKIFFSSNNFGILANISKYFGEIFGYNIILLTIPENNDDNKRVM